MSVLSGGRRKASLGICDAVPTQRFWLAFAAGNSKGPRSSSGNQESGAALSVLAADGAVLFLEKVSPALEHVDSSSGAIGTAVNHAIDELVSVIAKAPADLSRRAKWLERLWDAYLADAMPYIETLSDFWGELCVTKELASMWADNLIEPLEAVWRDHGTASYFQGTPVCLSSLLAAGRYQELLDLLKKAPSI